MDLGTVDIQDPPKQVILGRLCLSAQNSHSAVLVRDVP